MNRKNALTIALVSLVLAVGTILLYAPAFRFDFVNYDDQQYVINNPHINTGFHWSEFAWYFQAGYAGNWHPLTWISHAIDCSLFGLNPGGPHAVNLVLHAINSVLVFLLLFQLTGAIWRAAAVAALFAWHPLHVESVAWIAERKDVLSAFFFLSTIMAYVRYARGAKIYYLYALLLFALGLMAKPMLVTLPCILLLLDFWPLQRFGRVEEKVDLRWLGPLIIEKVPLFLLSIGSSIITIVAQTREGVPTGLADLPIKNRLVNAELTFWRYLQKLVWPSDLGATYPYIFHASKLKLIGVAIALVGVTFVAIRLARRRPYWLLGWFWFVLMLLPVIDLFHAGGQPMADRYMYLPSIGLFVLLCWEAADLAGKSPRAPIILGAVAAVALAACLTVSSRQVQIWRNEGTMLARIPEPDINFYAHANYAAYLMHHDQLPEADNQARTAIAIDPSNPMLPALLGEVQRREGKLDDAVNSLRKALDLKPDLAEVHLPLGQILLQKGDAKDAAGEFDMVLQATPNDPIAHWWHGNALVASGNFAGGLDEFAAALKIQPNYPEALNDAAWVLATTPDPHFHDADKALTMAQRACELTKDSRPRMLGTLAAAYAAQSKWDDAIATAQKARQVALDQGDKALADQELELETLYGEHSAYYDRVQ